MKRPAPQDFGTETDEILVRFLLKDKILSEPQVDRARKIRERVRKQDGIFPVLNDLRLLDPQTLRECLRRHREEIPIGVFLIQSGAVGVDAVERSLKKQRSGDARRIGEILVQDEGLSQKKFLLALGDKKNLPFVELRTDMIDAALFSKMPAFFLEENGFVPFSQDGVSLFIVVADPDRSDFVETVRKTYGLPVRICLGHPDQIRECIRDLARQGGRIEARKEVAFSTDEEGGMARGPGTAEEADASRIFSHLLTQAIDMGASDLHVEPIADRLRIRFRIDGVLIHKTDLPIELAGRLSSRIKVLSGMDVTNRRVHQDGRSFAKIGDQEIDLRISSYVSLHGETLVLRILSRKKNLASLEDLGMAPNFLARYVDHALDPPTGVVLITGPTGSGKTTTLYSSIDRVNQPDIKIITIEDPIEYAIPGIIQAQVHTKAGLTFESSLRSIVRQDPDVIVLGEIRDKLTAATVIQAALTGHKVLSTFHTEDAVGSLIRLIDMDIETFLISSTVISIVAQRLVRRICSECREPVPPNPRAMRLMETDTNYFQGFQLYAGRGCSKCNDTGFKGRVGVYEFLFLNADMRDAILKHQSSDVIRTVSFRSSSLVSLMEDGLVKAALGLTTPDEVLQQVPRGTVPRPIQALIEMEGYAKSDFAAGGTG